MDRHWIAIGALICALGVVAGAFGAHALRAALESTGDLENWRTAVRYQVWHGLALVALAPAVTGLGLGRSVLAAFVAGVALFSGSIFGLSLGGPASVLGPITPLGGLLLIGAWLGVARAALRSPQAAVGGAR